jgi:hypothetical protein
MTAFFCVLSSHANLPLLFGVWGFAGVGVDGLDGLSFVAAERVRAGARFHMPAIIVASSSSSSEE